MGNMGSTKISIWIVSKKPFEDDILPHSPQLVRFAQLPYDFVILGDTHIAMVQRVDFVTMINPGSCAPPRD